MTSPTIKHRIVNKATGEVIAYEWVDGEGNWRHSLPGGKFNWYGAYERDAERKQDIVRERFTGRQDVNGIDIYEGDDALLENFIELPNDKHSDVEGEVIFRDGAFEVEDFEESNGFSVPLFAIESKEIEVVGHHQP